MFAHCEHSLKFLFKTRPSRRIQVAMTESPMPESPQTARSLLFQSIEDLKARNPRLSLRAIALMFKTAPSMLSEVLNGKKSLSPGAAARISRTLGFSTEKTEQFLTLIQLEAAKGDDLKNRLKAKLTGLDKRASVKTLRANSFSLISDWYHFGILEFSRIPGVFLTPEAVSKEFGLAEAVARDAIENLKSNEFLKEDSEGRLLKSDDRINVSSKVANSDIRKFHAQMLAKATESLQTQTPQEKFIGSETMAFDSKRLAAATEIIEDCFSRVVQLAAESETTDSVYHIGIQMFRLTKGPTQ